MLSQRHSLSFVGFGKSAFVPDAHGTVLDDVLALSGRPQFRGCRSFALRHNSHNRKELQIKNPQKNPSKSASPIDRNPRQEQNCCVLLGSQTLGAEFYSALSLSSLPTIQN